MTIRKESSPEEVTNKVAEQTEKRFKGGERLAEAILNKKKNDEP